MGQPAPCGARPWRAAAGGGRTPGGAARRSGSRAGDAGRGQVVSARPRGASSVDAAAWGTAAPAVARGGRGCGRSRGDRRSSPPGAAARRSPDTPARRGRRSGATTRPRRRGAGERCRPAAARAGRWARRPPQATAADSRPHSGHARHRRQTHAPSFDGDNHCLRRIHQAARPEVRNRVTVAAARLQPRASRRSERTGHEICRESSRASGRCWETVAAPLVTG